MKNEQLTVPTFKKTPQQFNVQMNNLVAKFQQQLHCPRQLAQMYIVSLLELEKQHPEYHLERIPLDKLIQFIAAVQAKCRDRQSLDHVLNGPMQDKNRLDSVLKQ